MIHLNINSFALKELVYGYSLPWYSYQGFFPLLGVIHTKMTQYFLN